MSSIAWPIAGWHGIAAGSLPMSANPVLARIFGRGAVGLAGAALGQPRGITPHETALAFL